MLWGYYYRPTKYCVRRYDEEFSGVREKERKLKWTHADKRLTHRPMGNFFSPIPCARCAKEGKEPTFVSKFASFNDPSTSDYYVCSNGHKHTVKRVSQKQGPLGTIAVSMSMKSKGDRGKRAFVRSRNTMRTRQTRREDVVHYRLSEIINEEEMNHLKLHE